MLPSDDVFAPEPQVRLKALQQYSNALEEAPEMLLSEGASFEALLRLVAERDPDESVRHGVLSIPQCPKSVLQHILNVGSEKTRHAVIRAIGNRRSHPPVTLLVQHIPLESNLKLKLFALKVFHDLLLLGKVPDLLLQKALGMHSPPTDALEQFDCEGVLRDCVESEQRVMRSATSHILVSLITQQHTAVAKAAFAMLETLVRDGDGRVAEVALSGMANLIPLRHELQLSEKCVRAMIVRYASATHRTNVLKAFAGIPCCSLKAYAMLQVFLKRRLYQSEMESRGEGEWVQELRRVLLSVVRRNEDFVRVLDLRETETHKMMRLIEP
ncbi:unnamed protein product [Agarophyton chilense]|eukprot:gb/GEZJ01002824.1/.p1 GENE.gb/GEZJ01002824.1/~~gb/GEZJ01002824.1/.p1  ORF type:complete len:327 (-),score=46.81 gb/GEZJ01002824.1/:1802-2782(-)